MFRKRLSNCPGSGWYILFYCEILREAPAPLRVMRTSAGAREFRAQCWAERLRGETWVLSAPCSNERPVFRSRDLNWPIPAPNTIIGLCQSKLAAKNKEELLDRDIFEDIFEKSNQLKIVQKHRSAKQNRIDGAKVLNISTPETEYVITFIHKDI